MNSVNLIGRLTRDPEIRSGGETAICAFSIAIDRMTRQDGTKLVDYPSIKVFGRQAESCGKYLKKGRQVAVVGRIQTGSYTNKDGNKVYTTEVVADRVEFLGSAGETSATDGAPKQHGFEAVEEEIPF